MAWVTAYSGNWNHWREMCKSLDKDCLALYPSTLFYSVSFVSTPRDPCCKPFDIFLFSPPLFFYFTVVRCYSHSYKLSIAFHKISLWGTSLKYNSLSSLKLHCCWLCSHGFSSLKSQRTNRIQKLLNGVIITTEPNPNVHPFRQNQKVFFKGGW